MRLISAFRLVAYAPVYLAAAVHDDFEVVTLAGLPGHDGPRRLRASGGDLLLGGPIRLLDEVRKHRASDLRVLTAVTNACPFYVVTTPDTRATPDGPVVGFARSDAPGRCLRAGADVDVVPAIGGDDGDIAGLLATAPDQRFLVPGDIAIPLERAGRARIVASLPDVLPNVVFSAIEAVVAHLPPPTDVALLRHRLDQQLQRCRVGPLGGLVEDLIPSFPELDPDDLRAIVIRYRRENVWPRRSTPDAGALMNYARRLDPELVQPPLRSAVQRLIA